MKTAYLVALAPLAVVACSAFNGADDPPAAPAPKPDSGAPDSHAPNVPDASPALGDAADASPSCATTAELELSSEADAFLNGGSCNGGNGDYGDSTYMNIGVGTGLIRFQATDDVVKAALRANTIVRADLVLSADPHCPDCGNGIETSAGTVEAHVLRSDWQEKVLPASGGRSGPDVCRRVGGNTPLGWGPEATKFPAIGTYDYEANANTAALTAGASSVTIPISPADLATRIDDAGNMSFYIRIAPGGPGGIIVATRESTTRPHPKLVITYCKP